MRHGAATSTDDDFFAARGVAHPPGNGTCRERPPWRSGGAARFPKRQRSRRNATEGVPYRFERPDQSVNRRQRNRRELPMTDTELRLMAAAAQIGLSRPRAATGM